MATLAQRVERAVKATSRNGLRVTFALKRVLSRRAHSLLVTAFPKSGSSFLVAALAETTGFLVHFLGQSYLAEQDLYLPRLLDAWSMDVVSHHHTRANPHNLELMARFGIRPVILTRAIDDCLVSLHDHLQRESPSTPTFSVGPEFFALPEARRYDALVALAAPWYVDFHVSWHEALRAGKIEALWLTYEEMMADPAGAIARVLDFHRIEVPRVRVDAALARLAARPAGTRLNVGVSGRGRARLAPAQRARLDAYAALYPWIDFSRMGLPL